MMKKLQCFFQVRSLIAGAAMAALMLLSLPASAQGVLSSAQTGTIQAEAQDDGYLIISGQRYEFDDVLSQVFINGEQVEDEVIDVGLVVRYTVNRDGVLTRLEVLGPRNLIQSLVEEC